MVRLMDLILVKIMWGTLKIQENCPSQKNCLSQENQKIKKHLSLEIWLSQEKNSQKVRIQLILIL